MAEELNFNFTWKVLDMLGKSLYSNPWSAISELVANGFDANATQVYVHIDASDKSAAIVEVLDNGVGLDDETMQNYVNVGFDRREYAKEKGQTSSVDVMGRKGIGKLAALYLSDDYSIVTKTKDGTVAWKTNREDSEFDANSYPKLEKCEITPNCILLKRLDEMVTGTIIHMNKVNLARYGEASFNALGQRLANHFLFESFEREILLSVLVDSGSPKFITPKKQVAFKNLMFVYTNYPELATQPKEICDLSGLEVKIPIRNKKDILVRPIEVLPFAEKKELFLYQGTDVFSTTSGESVEKEYELTGWIGLHSTIDMETACNNDDRFVKNQFYNPSQIRLYVRNKLAMENVLPLVGNTQAYSNYIEGEVSFSILDDDDLPDIATSSRQGFDETDKRVELLKTILGKIVGDLVRKREAIRKEIKSEEDNLDNRDDTRAKAEAVQQISDALDRSSLNREERSSLGLEIANKIRGGSTSFGAKAKDQYLIFLSHRRIDKLFAEFFYRLLESIGAQSSDFFYTSCSDTPTPSKDMVLLADQIKNAVTKFVHPTPGRIPRRVKTA